MNFKVKVYTDGSCLGNPGPGGYGVYLQKFDERGKLLKEAKLSGSEKATTNNRMEMLAIVKAFEFLNLKEISDSQIEVFSDSRLVVNTLTKNWKRKANQDIWLLMEAELARSYGLENKLSFHWVKGHAGHHENEIVDQLAFQAALRLQKSL